MLGKVSFCHVKLTVLCASNISLNDQKNNNNKAKKTPKNNNSHAIDGITQLALKLKV